MSRAALPIVFGGGVDRQSGSSAVTPATLEVADNVVLLRGRVAPRKGMGELRSNLGGCTYVAGMHPDRSTLRSVFVAAFGTPGQSDHRLEVWAGTGSGRDAALLATWVDPCESVEKARVIATQSGPYVILAHDEPSVDRRAPTVVVDLDAGTVVPLSAAWAGETGNYLRFRGVCAWLDYLVGWGFGTNLVDDPHMIRISDIADPLTFQEDAWLKAGQAGDAVLACLPSQVGLGGALLARKQTETFVVTGDNFDNFGGPSQVEALHGLAAPRLVVTDGATDWFWSLEGPRESRGGVSQNIAWPLGLYPWPTPFDIAAAGLLDDGFAVYQPRERVVHFVFGANAYSYTLEYQQWSYARLATPVHCGAILYARTGYEGASRGYPDFVSATAEDTDSYTIAWDDVSPEGDETVEVWLRRDGDAWGASPTATASISLAPEVTVDGLYAGDYELAIRYKRDGLYSAAGTVTGQPTYDYTGAPDTWPAVSQGAFTVATPAPSITSLVWSRQSMSVERVAVTYAGAFVVQILRNTTNDAGTATLIHTASGSSGTYNDDAPGTGETTVYYFVRHRYPDLTTGPASSGYARWIGPNAPTGLEQIIASPTYPADYYIYTLQWDAPNSGATTTVEDQYLCASVYATRGTTAADAVTVSHTVQKDSAMSEDGSEIMAEFDVRARHNQTAFTVTDNGEWAVLPSVAVRIAVDETAFNSCP